MLGRVDMLLIPLAPVASHYRFLWYFHKFVFHNSKTILICYIYYRTHYNLRSLLSPNTGISTDAGLIENHCIGSVILVDLRCSRQNQVTQDIANLIKCPLEYKTGWRSVKLAIWDLEFISMCWILTKTWVRVDALYVTGDFHCILQVTCNYEFWYHWRVIRMWS